MNPIPELKRAQRGFSLVEVALAIGIAAFCLLAIVGLLPIGLTAVKASREDGAAANSVKQIADSIRGATLKSGEYVALAYPDLTWTPGTTFEKTLPALTSGGQTAADSRDRALVAHVEIVPPAATSNLAGTAQISVAWPSQATWNTTKRAWDNAQGSVSTWLIYLPTKP